MSDDKPVDAINEKKDDKKHKKEKYKKEKDKKKKKKLEALPDEPTEIILDEFQINTRDKLGAGGFGKVYKAYNSKTGEFVAIKQIPVKNKRPEKIAEIKKEIVLLKELDHFHIVKYIGHKEQDGYLYIIMEYLENGSLAGLVKKFKVSENMVAKYIAQVLKGLEYLHSEGIIHRDIKGDNVLLTHSSIVKLADFGVAQNFSEIDSNDVVGTPYWMAPEIITLAGADYASDIWSVGCMVIELITGKPPYYDLNQMTAFFRIVTDEHPPIPPTCSNLLYDFLMLCFKKEPKLRKSASELLKHPWIRSNTEPPKPQINPIIKITPPGHSRMLKMSNDEEEEEEINFDIPDEEVVEEKTPKKSFKSILDKFKEDDDDDDIISFDSPEEEKSITPSSDKYDSVKYTTVVRRKKKRKSLMSEVDSPKEPVKKSLSDFQEKDDEEDDIIIPKDFSLNFNLKLKFSNVDDEEDDDNPFEKLDFGIQEDNSATLEQEIMSRMRLLVPQNPNDVILNAAAELTKLLEDEEMRRVFTNVVSSQCVIPIMELLIAYDSPIMILSILKLVNKMSEDNRNFQETLCLLGIFPKIMKFADMSPAIKQEASNLIYTMCNTSDLALQMFIASEGLPVLVKFLQHKKEDIANPEIRNMLYRTIDIILKVLNFKGTRNHKNDFCRLFSASDLVTQITDLMISLIEVNDAKTKTYLRKILDILFIFSSVDSVVKLHMTNPISMKRIYSVIPKLNPENKFTIFQCIKNITLDTTIQDALTETGALPILVSELRVLINQPEVHNIMTITYKMYSQVLNALFNLCGQVEMALAERKEAIAKEGVVPLLRQVLLKEMPLQELALRLLCGLAYSSNVTRRALLKDGGIDFMFWILKQEQHIGWSPNVLDVLQTLLANHRKKVLPHLVKVENMELILNVFLNCDKSVFVSLLEPFERLINLSHEIKVIAANNMKFINTIADWLLRISDPRHLKVSLNILSILFKKSKNPKQFVTRDVYENVKLIMDTNSKMVVVKLASSLIKEFQKYVKSF